MRIALASIHPRSLSGQIEGLVGLAHALERRGHTVTVVSAFPSRQLLGPDRHLLDSKPMLVGEPWRLMHTLVELVRLGPRVDLIQINLPTPAFSFVGDLLQRFVRVPVLVNFEAHLVAAADLLRFDRLRQAPAFYLPRLLINNRLIARLSPHRAAQYVVSSRYQKAELLALGVDSARIRRLPNILPADKLTPGDPRLRAKLPPGRLITYVGHYNHVKGVDVLLRAFERLAPRVPDASLVLAWSGLGAIPRFDGGSHSRLDGRIVQLGHVNVPALYAASHVVALPYRLTIGQAAYPAALLEALAAAVPVVTSDLPLLRELTRGQTALLTPPENPAALAEGIECLLNDPALAAGMRQAQRAWAEQIQPHRVVAEYERLYGQVLDRRATVPQTANGREQV